MSFKFSWGNVVKALILWIVMLSLFALWAYWQGWKVVQI